MSANATPISPERFAAALRDLQISSLHVKAAELRNSIAHLQRSNDELQPLAAEGDKDCSEAFWENLQVINRMEDRLRLLRAEVENRGYLWDVSEAGEPQPGQLSPPNESATLGSRGPEQSSHPVGQGSGINASVTANSTGGTMDDEELRRRLAEQMDEEEDGVHL